MIYIGISGWTYAPWRGVFYPDDLVQKKELSYASRQFPSIEINGTHYSLQRPKSFLHWYDETPEGFLFSVKGSRYITHMKRLKDIDTPLANFFASGVLALREKLGPFLWQFPPNFQFDAQVLEAFFAKLPRTTNAALRLAKGHNMVADRVWLESAPDRPLRHCIEIRHQSFMVPEFFALLRRHDIAFVFADTAGKWPYVEDLTSDFVYLRLHGDEELYVSGYSDSALDRWAKRIHRWSQGGQIQKAKLITSRREAPSAESRDVYVYFDNDVKVRAPADAKELRRKLKV